MRRPLCVRPLPSPVLGYISLQDLYARASRDLFAMAGQSSALPPPACALPAPAPGIGLVANAESENPIIAPNTWIEIKGANLAPVGISSPDCVPGYCWQSSGLRQARKVPTMLNKVSATINGKSAYVYYISPIQVDVLTPPDTVNGTVQVVVTSSGSVGAAFQAQEQPLSPAFFVASSRTLRRRGARRRSLHRTNVALSRLHYARQAE